MFRLREALEAQDVPEAQVDEKCDALRARLLRELMKKMDYVVNLEFIKNQVKLSMDTMMF